jgi:hypothetical protein
MIIFFTHIFGRYVIEVLLYRVCLVYNYRDLKGPGSEFVSPHHTRHYCSCLFHLLTIITIVKLDEQKSTRGTKGSSCNI